MLYFFLYKNEKILYDNNMNVSAGRGSNKKTFTINSEKPDELGEIKDYVSKISAVNLKKIMKLWNIEYKGKDNAKITRERFLRAFAENNDIKEKEVEKEKELPIIKENLLQRWIRLYKRGKIPNSYIVMADEEDNDELPFKLWKKLTIEQKKSIELIT